MQKAKKTEAVIILDNIRSVHNVGSIFRTADAAGVSHIYLSGVTPAPIDRFGRKRKDLSKVSLGSEDSVTWSQIGDIKNEILRLKREGYTIIAVEQSKESIFYKKIKKLPKMCFIFGSETEGLDKDILDLSDQIAEIPMHGMKESLNVAVTAGIVLFEILVED